MDGVHGIGEGLQLVIGGDARVVELTLRTLWIALEATLIAALIGIPLGCLLGLGRFRGRRGLLAVANAGIRFPPIAVGQILWLLLWPRSLWGGGPLAGLGWIYADAAAILAQTILALPVVTALTASAVQGVSGGLLEQSCAFGASKTQQAALALREARASVVAAVVAALGIAISTVGAILVVGRPPVESTLATAALAEWNASLDDSLAVAYGSVLLGLFLLLAAALTIVQQRRAPWRSALPS